MLVTHPITALDTVGDCEDTLDGEAEQYEATFEYELEKDGDRWLVVSVDTDVEVPEVGTPEGGGGSSDN